MLDIVRTWNPEARDATLAPARTAALADPHRYLRELIQILGKAASVSRLIDVDRAQVTRWQQGDPISAEMSRRIVDAHTVLLRAAQLWDPRAIPDWLYGSEPHLGGARPIDVLAMFGASRVLSALSAIETEFGLG